jgi:hypothetical protein
LTRGGSAGASWLLAGALDAESSVTDVVCDGVWSEKAASTHRARGRD